MILGAIEGLSAWWLAAGVAMSAPVVAAHLFGRRGRRIVFPPASLLSARTPRSGAGDRIREILRLALRVLALMLIAAAFSGPVWRSAGAKAGADGGRDLLIIIDRSASMARIDRGVSIFDRAIAEAVKLLDEADPMRDRVAMLAVGATTEALLPEWSTNMEALRERVLAMRLAREHGDAAAALRRAADFVERSRGDGRAARVVVFTDGQASQWADAPDKAGGQRIEWVDLGAGAAISNVAVTGIVAQAGEFYARESARIGVRIARFGAGVAGSEPATVPVTLDAGGTTQTHAVAIGTGHEQTVWFDIVSPSSGPVRLRAEVPADALGADNSTELTLSVQDRPVVTLVIPRRDTAYADSLIAAIEAASGTPPDVVRGDEIPASTGGMTVVVGAIGSLATDRLGEHLELGGSLVWIVDSRAAAASLAAAAARGVAPVSPIVDWRDDGSESVDAASARAFFDVDEAGAAAAIDSIARDTHVSSRAIVRASAPSAPVRGLSLVNGDPLAIVLGAGASTVTIIPVDPAPSASNITRSALWPMLLDVALRGPEPTPTLVDALDPRESDLSLFERVQGSSPRKQPDTSGAGAVRAGLELELTQILLFVALAVVFGDLFFGTRGGTGWWITLVGAGLIAVAVADPQRPADATGGAARPLVILLDTSESMGVADAGANGDARRIDVVRAGYLNNASLAEIEESGVLLRAALLGSASAMATMESLCAAQPTGARSPLVSSIEHAIAAAGANGCVLVLTDGAETEQRADARILADRAIAAGVRVDAVVVGSEAAIGGPRLVARASPGVVFAGEQATIITEVFTADTAGLARIELREGDAVGTVIESYDYVQGASVAEFKFEVTPSGEGSEARGWSGYTVALVADEGGSARTVAARQVFIETLEQPVRVLVLDGRPGWQTAFFVDALRDEPRVDVTSVSAVSPNRVIVRKSSPRDASEAASGGYSPSFGNYDLVALGRRVGQWFDDDAAAALERYIVDDGGAVLFLRGDAAENDPAASASASFRDLIERIMPGNDHVDPSLARALGASDAVTDAVVGAAAPMFAVRQIGFGRVAAVADEELWRRALAPSETRTAFGEHWSRATRWLALGGAFAPGAFARIEIEDGPRAPGETISAMLRVRGEIESEPVRAVVHDPDGRETAAIVENSALERSGWRIRFTLRREGTHVLRAEFGGKSVSAPIVVQEDRRERIDIAARPGWLRELSVATGGRLWAGDDADGFVRDVVEATAGSDRSAVAAGPRGSEPIWNTAWFFMLVTGTLVAGWLVRRGGA